MGKDIPKSGAGCEAIRPDWEKACNEVIETTPIIKPAVNRLIRLHSVF
jgi:hypothetical protein